MEEKSGRCEWCGEFSKHLRKEQTQGAYICPSCKEVIPEMIAVFTAKEREEIQ